MSLTSFRISAVLGAALLAACGSKPGDVTVDQVVARNDTLTTTRGAPVQTGNVLANDSDPKGYPFYVTAWTQGTLGDVTYDGNGVFTYAPRASIPSGADSFTYTIVNGLGTSATGTVDVTITPSWGTPAVLASSDSAFTRVRDAAGNVSLFWAAIVGTRLQLWASRVTASGAVGTATRIDSEDLATGSTIQSVQAVADASGDVVVAWLQNDGTHWNAWANRMTAAGAWETAATKISDGLNSVGPMPPPVVDGSGNVTAVWGEWDGTVYNMWSNRMTAAGAWETPAKIESEAAGNAGGAQLFVDGAGNVTAFWVKWDGSRNNLRANRMSAAGTWGTPTFLSNGVDNVQYGFQVAPTVSGSQAGAYTLMWYQYTGAVYNIYGAHLSPTGSAASQLLSDGVVGPPAHNAFPLQLVACPGGTGAGNVVAFWEQFDGAQYNVWASRMSAAGTWGASTQVNTTAGQLYAGSFVQDPACNVTAVWSQWDGTRYNMWANRMTTAGAWGTAELIETENLGSALPPVAAADASGNVSAVWSQYDGTRYNQWANRYSNSTSTWGTATKIETEDLGSVSSPVVVLDGSGNVTAVWSQSDGVHTNLWANRMAAAGAWGTALKIEGTVPGNVYGAARVVVDTAGTVTTAWTLYQDDGARRDVWVNRMDATGAWSGAQNLTASLPGAYGNVADVLFEGTTVPLIVGTQYNGSAWSLWTSDLR